MGIIAAAAGLHCTIMQSDIRTEVLESLGQSYIEQMTASIPLKHLGTVEDLANAALFFASDEAA